MKLSVTSVFLVLAYASASVLAQTYTQTSNAVGSAFTFEAIADPTAGFVNTVTTDCVSTPTANDGCGVQSPDANSFGPILNTAGGGYYAVDRITTSIKHLSDRSSGFPASLVELHSGGQQPSIKALHITLQKTIDGFKHAAYIILDTPDEYTSREQAIARIEDIMHCKGGALSPVMFSIRLNGISIEDKLQCMVPLTRFTLNEKLADLGIKTHQQ
ncbi:glycoside hydrolase family 16 protein [Athelia psychrophila]|uniref:Glycoside hydrolase family 16 protein n=1 Tax=Athelia psychrophila TaxID=1759441 RepID=A0A167TTF4_9AGAM|nr:glycoside hydrolase family 16 protein [Fibularhizoctonia sp. CBS 109695]